MPTGSTGISLLVKLRLNKNTGTGTFKYYGTNAVYGRGTIECWRETLELPVPPPTNALPVFTGCNCLFTMQPVGTIPPHHITNNLPPLPPLPPTPLNPGATEQTNTVRQPPLTPIPAIPEPNP